MQLRPYVFFGGTCEEALSFYEQCGLGKIGEVMRFEGSPMEAVAAPAMAQKIMHAAFDGPGFALFASDHSDGGKISGAALTLSADDLAEGERLFAALSDGGTVKMPFGKQFWGGYLGNLTDRFGVPWMVNFEPAR